MEWISVKDRLPETVWDESPDFKHISGQVNILTYLNVVGTAAYNSKTGIWFCGGLTKEMGYMPFPEDFRITHWMPLPSPPKTEKI